MGTSKVRHDVVDEPWEIRKVGALKASARVFSKSFFKYSHPWNTLSRLRNTVRRRVSFICWGRRLSKVFFSFTTSSIWKLSENLMTVHVSQRCQASVLCAGNKVAWADYSRAVMKSKILDAVIHGQLYHTSQVHSTREVTISGSSSAHLLKISQKKKIVKTKQLWYLQSHYVRLKTNV